MYKTIANRKYRYECADRKVHCGTHYYVVAPQPPKSHRVSRQHPLLQHVVVNVDEDVAPLS